MRYCTIDIFHHSQLDHYPKENRDIWQLTKCLFASLCYFGTHDARNIQRKLATVWFEAVVLILFSSYHFEHMYVFMSYFVLANL